MPARSGRFTDLEQPAVRVFTLGRFRVEVAGAPLKFGRKAQRRPIDLLKLLIAYGGEAVPAEQLAIDLWPDSEGHEALDALRTTVGRLRKLLGAKAVLTEGGALTLNPEVCWTDASAIAQRLTDCRHGGPDACCPEPHTALEEALTLYCGTFLPGEDGLLPVLSARAGLHGLFLRSLADLGRCYERAAQFDRAMNVYRRGLEVDAAAEEIARKLMQICASSGRSAEGIAVYRSCQAALKARLGVEPSAATRRVYEDLLRATVRDAQTRVHPAAAPVAPALGARPDELSIVIPPFEDLSPRGDHRRLATAVRETIISLLSELPQLSLVTGHGLAVNGGRMFDPNAPYRNASVRYVLRGSVMALGGRSCAAAHLIDARTGEHVWSERLEYTSEDEISVRDRIAIQMAEGLFAKLVSGEYTRLLLSPDVEAWKAETQCHVLMSTQTRENHRRARALIARALEGRQQEPSLVSWSATLRVQEYWKNWAVDPVRELRTAERILRLQRKRYGYGGPGMPSLSWACALRGDIDEALRLAASNVERMPESFRAHAFMGVALLYQGSHARALDSFIEACRLRPRPMHWLWKDRSVAQFCAGWYEEAALDLASVLRDPLQQDNDLLNARMMYVANLAAGARADEARHEARATLAAHPTVSAHRWCEWHFRPYRDKGPAQRIERVLGEAGLPG